MKVLIVVGVLLGYFCTCNYATLEFTNCVCTSLNKSYVNIEYCFLKSVNRTYKYLSLRANIYQVPIKNLTLNFALYKRASGYKPFLYNVTFDVCSYLKHRKNKIVSFFHSGFEPYSNMNHTCPYEEDIFVEKMPISQISNMFRNILPFPSGDYKFDSVWYTYGIPRARFALYFTV